MAHVRISRLRAFAARVRRLFGPRKRDSDFDEEMRAHLQLLVDHEGRQELGPRKIRVNSLNPGAVELRACGLLDYTSVNFESSKRKRHLSAESPRPKTSRWPLRF